MEWKMKVLIADDEPNIREGLKTLVNWENLQCRLVGEAQNGEEGMEMILSLQPDLVIVDIKMPEVDGLELIERITGQGMDTRFIVLSGYRDFDYAKRAMECKVNHYILKPIDEQLLEQKICEIYAEWAEHKKRQAALEQQCRLSREQVIQYLSIGHEAVDSFLYSTGGYGELNRWYELGLPWQSYTILLVDAWESKLSFPERNLVKQLFHETEKQYRCFEIDGMVGVLVKNRHFDRQSGSLSLLRDRIVGRIDREIMIAVGITVEELDEVRKSYAYARYLMDNRFLYDNLSILREEAIGQGREEQPQATYREDVQERLYQAACTGQPAQINFLLEEVRSHMERCRWNAEKIKAFYLHMYVSVMTSLIKNQHGILEQEFLSPKIFEGFYQQSNLLKLHGFIKYQFMTICSCLEQRKPQNTLGKVINYMEHHFREDLTIEALGIIFHYSSNYLGKQLKKETGKSFNTIMDDLRIKEAQRLLENPGLKIYEVSKMSGFHDPDYFAAKFKKLSGLSPKEYRAMYGI